MAPTFWDPAGIRCDGVANACCMAGGMIVDPVYIPKRGAGNWQGGRLRAVVRLLGLCSLSGSCQ
jgi:hypothetical protein